LIKNSHSDEEGAFMSLITLDRTFTNFTEERLETATV